MSIEVGNILGNPAPAAKESPIQVGKKETGAFPQAQQNTDSVHLTDTANQLKQAERSLQSVPTVNAERIAEIARAIERGEYPIDAERLAEKFLQLEREIAES